MSEAHLCVDVAGWELAVGDAAAFVTRGHRRGLRLEDEDETPPGLQINLNGRRCGTLDFSKGAAHSCCIYDKTKEITVSRKDWMQEVWTAQRLGWRSLASRGWSSATSANACGRWASKRRTPSSISSPACGRTPPSSGCATRFPPRIATRRAGPPPRCGKQVQQATFFGDGVPAVRERKTAGDLLLICQMLAGCSTTASALLTNALPLQDDGTHFLIWFMTWLERLPRAEGHLLRGHHRGQAPQVGRRCRQTAA